MENILYANNSNTNDDVRYAYIISGNGLKNKSCKNIIILQNVIIKPARNKHTNQYVEQLDQNSTPPTNQTKINKPRGNKRVYSSYQISELEKVFELSLSRRVDIARRLGLNEYQVNA
ncbi:uncharacterized protein LOC143194220 [Rhynchophorus ferrugineus]|uniref:uncharacterized protein LOC143194220 n=1 Tax=Rhynchophorus ferrugineus TaxID=354439 RepID=UPI003FCD64F1